MFLRVLSISATAIVVATAVYAQQPHSTQKNNMFESSRLHQAIGGNAGRSTDAILPDGTINLDFTTTGSVDGRNTNSFTQPRMQCDAAPVGAKMRSSTYGGYGCP